jgi:Calcineurin-like phosphoesterase
MTTIFPRFVLAPILLFLCVPAATAQNNRLTAIISDTHFGVGKTPDGNWHPYEDARWATEFRLFLEELDREGQGNTDLILNGDTFELWQSLENDCTYPNDNLSCTEQDALKRVRTVIAAHQTELNAIRAFATSGNNTVFILPGNHDAPLMFPAVAGEVLRAIGAPSDRVTISRDGYWLSADGLIYAEHGHQIGYDTNRYSDWPRPFIQQGGVNYLQRPWGEQFVQRFYNYYERRYPIIDNLMEESLGVKYGAIAEGLFGLQHAVGRFALFYLVQSSGTQIGQSLGGQEKGVRWDIAAIRKLGNRFFVESIPSDDPLRALVQRAMRNGTLGINISNLSDEELQSICDVRAAVANQKPPRVTPCPKAKLGAIGRNLITSRETIFQKHLNDTLTRLRARGSATDFRLFIFAHTHLPESSYSPFRSLSGWQPIVVNSGAWQRTYSEQQLERDRKSRRLKASGVLQLQPENLPACYPVVTIPPYAGSPQSLLRYWKQVGNDWMFTDTCN